MATEAAVNQALASAPVVSRVLRKAGFLPVPRAREGIHVTRSVHGVTVTCDFDHARKALHVADEAGKVLADAGYSVLIRDTILTVWRN